MRIRIKTPVDMDHRTVMSQFDRTLFEALTPPGANVELIRFDGSKMGDIVHLRLKLFGLWEEDWISDIIEDELNDEVAYFTDRGSQLPFFLRAWHHHHRVERRGSGSVIIDDIRYKSPNRIMDILLYLVLYLQFLYRKPIYRKFFGKPHT